MELSEYQGIWLIASTKGDVQEGDLHRDGGSGILLVNDDDDDDAK
jgi:hypothetical protein